jgi:hypothetical protein
MVAKVGYSVARRLGGWVTPCAVCTVHVEKRSASFLVEPQNQDRRFVTGTVFSGLTLKPVAMVSPGLASKPVMCFLVEPQNQGSGGFPSLGLKTGSYSLMIWVSKSPRQFIDLCLKTEGAMVCRLRLKTEGRAMTWDTR